MAESHPERFCCCLKNMSVDVKEEAEEQVARIGLPEYENVVGFNDDEKESIF